MNLPKLLARLTGALALLLPGCATPATPALEAQSVQAEVAPEGAEPGPALWQVSDEDTTIYLFGTVHFLPDGVPWFDQRIESALSASGEYVTEMDTANLELAGPLMSVVGTLEEGRALRDFMSAQDRAEYDAAMISLGLPIDELDSYEPWWAAMNLELFAMNRAGYTAAGGVERTLESRAAGKLRVGLESVEEQVALFDTLPVPDQLTYLDNIVAALPSFSESIDAMVAEWLEGDAEALAHEMNDGTFDEALYQRFLVDRNANWADWIEQRLDAPGEVFVAVGAGHLAGPGSVQQQLAERGIAVRRVWQ